MKQIQDPVWVADKMMQKGAELNKEHTNLVKYGNDTVELSAHYDNLFAQTIMSLKSETAATIIKEVAKGQLWQERMARDKAEIMYNTTKQRIQILLSQLTALQSIYKHLDIVHN